MVHFFGINDDNSIKIPTPDKDNTLVQKPDNTKVVINFIPPVKAAEPEPSEEEYQKMILTDAVKSTLPNVSEKFIEQIYDMAQKLDCDTLDVAALLFKESEFQPNAGNGSFKGLGQMNGKSLALSIKYARENPEEMQGIDVNMTLQKFTKLSREQQMPYVKNYALAMKKEYFNEDKKLTGGDLYALFLTPGYAKKHTLVSAKSKNLTVRKMYRNNRGLDKVNEKYKEIRDGKITKNDLQFTLDSIKTDVFRVDPQIFKKTKSLDQKA